MTIYLSDDEANVFYNIFCCKRTDFSFKYLGDPLHHTKLRKEDDHQKGGWHLSARCCYSLFNQQRKPAAAAWSEELAAAATALQLRYPLPAATVQSTKETSSSSAVAARVAARLLASLNEHLHLPTLILSTS
jgi:hypothetical protein